MKLLVAVEIVSGDNCRAALRVFVGWTVVGIVAALDAGTRTARFDELDVVVIAQADTALGVSHSTGASAGVVLAPCVAGVQSVEFIGTDAPSDCKLEI